MSDFKCFRCNDGNTPLYCLNCAEEIRPKSTQTIASLQSELEKANLEIMSLAEQLDDKPKSVKDRKKRNSSEETDSAASAVALIAALVCLVCICIGRGAEAIAAAIIHATAVYDYHTSL